MALSFQIERNEGIHDIDIEDSPRVISKMNGASHATVYLVEKSNTKIVRKYIRKHKSSASHVAILKRQCEDIRRLDYYSPGLVPKIIYEYDSNSEYYYDMEYLEDYVELSKLDKTIICQVLPKVFMRLKDDVYCYKKKIDGIRWLKDYLQEKIYKRLPTICSFGDDFDTIISSPTLVINGMEIKGIKESLSEINLNDVIPLWVSPIHGDLTLENILFNINTGDFKLIDPAGSRYVDAFELDFAKCMQSFISKYEKWNNCIDIIKIEKNNVYVAKEFLDIDIELIEEIICKNTDEDKNMIKKSIFFLTTHLIRLVPYTIHKSREHALFALSLSAYYLHYTFTVMCRS